MNQNELIGEVNKTISEHVEKMCDDKNPPHVHLKIHTPTIERNEEFLTMEKKARFTVLSAHELAEIKNQVVADVVELTDSILVEAESVVKELVTDAEQQHQVLSYMEAYLRTAGVDVKFDKPEIAKTASTETQTSTANASLRDRISKLAQ